MFCFNFEKTALDTSTIAKAMAGRLAQTVGKQGLQAGRQAVRGIEAKTSQLAAKGSIGSAGQRTAALQSLVPKTQQAGAQVGAPPVAKAITPKAPAIATSAPAAGKSQMRINQPKYNVFKAQSDRLMNRNTPYSKM